MKKTTVFLIVLFMQSICVISQTVKPEKSKIYKSIGSGVNKEAVLILYNDNSFTNYGIYSNDIEKDWYVWYTTGRLLRLPDKILFKSNDTITNAEKLIKVIKDSYLRLKEHTLICKEYEFVQLKYKDLPMFVEDSLVIDGVKKITYLEQKP